ncbi:LIM/homeobox protein Awh [Clonorchis sinensis]|uniref:LIM/homeobox protein Awh n=1 Tax=Clonorchis sinensis TaxID=79923 RepID=H2KUX3_CLOSI|nr:LIM/homeobox protein Awh [Clonorchis sinensis]
MMSGFYDPPTDLTEPMNCTEKVETTSNDYERPQTIQGRTMEPDSRRSNTRMQTHNHIDNVICSSEANDETGTTRHTGIHSTDILRPEEEPVKNKADSPFLHQSLNRRSASVPIPQKHDNLVSSSVADSLYPSEELIEMDDMASIAITAASVSLLSTESPFVTAENSGHSIDSSTSSGCSVHSKSKRIRTSFTPDQLAILQANFDVEANPDGQELERIANVARLNKRVTQVWFQNARARKKKIECKGLGPFSHLTMNCSAYYMNESNASKEDLMECGEDGHPQSQNHPHSGEQLASFLYDPFSSIKPMTFPCSLIDFPSIPIPPASFLHPFVNISPADLEQHLSNGFNEITYPTDRSNSSMTCPRYLHSKVPEFVLKDMSTQEPSRGRLLGLRTTWPSQHNLWSEVFLPNTIRRTSALLIQCGFSSPDGKTTGTDSAAQILHYLAFEGFACDVVLVACRYLRNPVVLRSNRTGLDRQHLTALA